MRCFRGVLPWGTPTPAVFGGPLHIMSGEREREGGAGPFVQKMIQYFLGCQGDEPLRFLQPDPPSPSQHPASKSKGVARERERGGLLAGLLRHAVPASLPCAGNFPPTLFFCLLGCSRWNPRRFLCKGQQHHDKRTPKFLDPPSPLISSHLITLLLILSSCCLPLTVDCSCLLTVRAPFSRLCSVFETLLLPATVWFGPALLMIGSF
jgi:hypothetical protein